MDADRECDMIGTTTETRRTENKRQEANEQPRVWSGWVSQ